MKHTSSTYRSSVYVSTVRLFIICSILYVSGCKKNEGPTAAEIMTQKLTTTTWKVSTVTIDGVDNTSKFTGMTLTFTSSTYSTTNGNMVWPVSGSWAFSSDEANMIKRDDGIVVSLSEVTDAKLKISFIWNKTTFGPGRIVSTNGKYDFVMVK